VRDAENLPLSYADCLIILGVSISRSSRWLYTTWVVYENDITANYADSRIQILLGDSPQDTDIGLLLTRMPGTVELKHATDLKLHVLIAKNQAVEWFKHDMC
jgi:hypothetical protein